jgi:nitroimidazol reductase NimA-like FMN-containing flavoprotein (pyridoxamine 5'-phosphate oxidase superfamily)
MEPGAELAILEPQECWRLLATSEVGRLAVTVGGHPDIFPVNFIVDRGSVVFRTAEGTKLVTALLGHGVAFECDGHEPASGEAWSVVVKGKAIEMVPERALGIYEPRDVPLFPWHPSPKTRVVRIEAHQVTGRRFRVAGGTGARSPH